MAPKFLKGSGFAIRFRFCIFQVSQFYLFVAVQVFLEFGNAA
jgi:hypothetical protein